MITTLRKNCTVNIKSNRLMSCLSLSTMSLLVLSSIVIITIINVTPIIILGLGQLEGGQRDLIIKPTKDYLNATKISLLTGNVAMPRFNSLMIYKYTQVATVWFMDFALQKQQHLGTIGGDEPPNHRFIYAHESLNLKVDEHVSISLGQKTVLNAIRTYLNNQESNDNRQEMIRQLNQLIDGSITVKGNFTVKQTFATASGKFGIGNVNSFIYADIKYALQQMIEDTYIRLDKQPQKSALLNYLKSSSFHLGDYSSQITINIPNRIQVYSNPDYDETQRSLTAFCQDVLEKIGMFSVDTQMPIAQNYVNLGYVGMFIGVMLKLIVAALFMLSVIMMNNMLLMGVERKNFDFALMKMMGANKFFIIINLLSNSLKYVFFSNLIAYPLAYLTLEIVTDVFEVFFGYKHQINPSTYSIIGGIVIGVMVPIISSIAPIWGVVQNDLVENLDPIHTKTQGTKTEVYVQGQQFPLGKFMFGFLATFYGLMIYYLLPKSLITLNLGLLLTIFFTILMGLLVGLILLSYSFQYILQQIVAYVTFFWLNKVDFILTLKNLSSHRFKNRRSSILYALSVSFVIFVSVGLQIQLQTIYNEVLKRRGCYIEVRGFIDKPQYDQKLSKIDGIQDWAYVTASLNNYMLDKGVRSIMISDKPKLFFAENKIYGVSPNYINTFYFDRVSVFKTVSSPPYDPYSYLYSQNGFMTCTISSYIADRFGLTDDFRQFYINLYYDDKQHKIAVNYSSIFDKRIGLLYSPIMARSEVGVSFDTYRFLAGIASQKRLPLRVIKVKIKDPAQAGPIANKIRALQANGDIVWDYTELKDTIDKISNLLDNILSIFLTIVLTISFFSLVTTSYVNIISQTNQIGILMILGYQKSRIIRIYIYQNFILVINSCMIGVAVGYFVAWMMGLQRQLFSDLPVFIEVQGLGIIIFAAVISSCLSVYQPLREIFGNSISKIMNYAK